MGPIQSEVRHSLNQFLAQQPEYQRLTKAAQEGIALDWLEDVPDAHKWPITFAAIDGLRVAADKIAKELDGLNDLAHYVRDRLNGIEH
jgi:hypothetical protein